MWSICSHSCAGGLSSRTRNCDNPTPTLHGNDCIGHDGEDRQCNTFNCPSEYVGTQKTFNVIQLQYLENTDQLLKNFAE